jgi:MFS family permease
MSQAGPVVVGLRANWRQFALLVLVNAFVGATVGVERGVLPLVAERDFQLTSQVAALSFLISFGLVKALANLAAGRLSDRVGRKPLLVLGWLVGLPAPLLVAWAPSWGWVVAANLLLGANQGLCWSTTVVMKIDLAGPRQRGLAMGLNEFAGYLAVSLAALAAGYVAAVTALRPEPFLLAEAFALAGLALSALLVRETHGHTRQEARLAGLPAPSPPFWQVFAQTSWRNRSLFAASQAGLVNNLNDGVAWGLFPLYFTAAGLDLQQVGFLAAIYPAVWSVAQLGTGALSDRLGRKWLIVGGMLIQGAALALVVVLRGLWLWVGALALLGLGTALVYPTLLAAVADTAEPTWRASAVGVYRLWRDSGYVIGALLAGVLADRLGIPSAILAVAALTAASGLAVALCMVEMLVREKEGHGGGLRRAINA